MAAAGSTDMERYADMMERQYPKQYAFAVSDTINRLARESRDEFRDSVSDREFEKKNRYLEKVVDDQRNTTRQVENMASEFGELERKLGKKTNTQLTAHETGGRIKPLRRRKRLHDATQSGRGGNYRKPIRKAVAKSEVKTVRSLKPTSTQRARGFYPRTSKGRTIGLIAWALRTKYKGLLRFTSPVKGKYGDYKIGRGGKIKMVRNLERRQRTVAGKDWMRKSYTKPVENRGQYYAENMDRQIDYLKSVNRL